MTSDLTSDLTSDMTIDMKSDMTTAVTSEIILVGLKKKKSQSYIYSGMTTKIILRITPMLAHLQVSSCLPSPPSSDFVITQVYLIYNPKRNHHQHTAVCHYILIE